MCSRTDGGLPCEICAECIADLEPDRPVWSFDREWAPSADCERVALMFPSLASIARMHPLDRAWFTEGDRGRWVRENFAGGLPLWAWVTIGGVGP